MNAPPLPDKLKTARPQKPAERKHLDENTPGDGLEGIQFPPWFNSVRAGAWLVNYTPFSGSLFDTYDGTIRVEHQGSNTIASGDLYKRPNRWITTGGIRIPAPGPAPDPASGIPILTIGYYRYYLRITEILETFTTEEEFTLGFQLWAFDNTTNTFNTTADGNFSALMKWIPAPAGYPSANNYLEGDVKNGTTGTIVGRLKMGWVSRSLRKMTIEIDTVVGCNPPLTNVAGRGWRDILGDVGFDVNFIRSENNIPESADGWDDSEMHQAMLTHRESVDLNQEWRYHILVVKKINSTERGVMYDTSGTDSNHVPREGVGIAAKWVFPEPGTPVPHSTSRQPDWGDEKGKVFDQARDPYMRAAVHELGHAFGLRHPDRDSPPGLMDRTFMCASNSIAQAATPATPTNKFPTNIVWAYSDANLKRLRHYSDLFIRPGGVEFDAINSTRPLITPTDSGIEVPGLNLEVEPLLGEVPLGAPVRVNVKLTNVAEDAVKVPADISLKSHFVQGFVKDSAGTLRSFSPLVRCLDGDCLTELEPGKSLEASLTLLRGGQGALFQGPGIHEIIVQIQWDVEGSGTQVVVHGKSTVLVTGSQSASHAAAAHKVLATPDAHLVLVLGGDHLKDGIEAIQKAVHDDVLGPHFACIEAKRLAKPFKGRSAERQKASQLLKKGTVMSYAEAHKLDKLLKAGGDGRWA